MTIKHIIPISMLLLAMAGLSLAQSKPHATPQPKPGATANNAEAAITARLESFSNAWNKHDAAAMTACWAPHGDLINPFGRVAKGKPEVQKLFQDEHGSGFAKDSKFQIVQHTVRMLKPDVALVDVDVTIAGVKPATPAPAGAPDSPMKSHITFVMMEEAGEWLFMAARPVIYAPAPDAKPAS